MKWEDEGVYSALGVFANEIVSMLASGETTHFPELFGAVERLLVEGDAGVRYATTYGLLEDIGNSAANKRGWPFAATFRRWFGPATSAAWEEIHRVWGTADLE